MDFGLVFKLLSLAITVLAWLVILVVPACLYDRFVLEPKRPVSPPDQPPTPAPAAIRLAWNLLPFTLAAAVYKIGVPVVMGWLMILAIPLSWLALPVLLIWAHDKWFAEPARPRDAQGQPAPPPFHARLARWLFWPVLIALVLRIGVPTVVAWLKVVAVPLSWLAIPVGLWCAIDSWILAPKRAVAAGMPNPPDPVPVRVAYAVLPFLVVAVIVRLITAESLDFSLVLLVLSVGTGLVWLIDHFVFRKPREAAAAAARPAVALPEPGVVDYARSFFPVAFIVLLVRAFIFEPFRIPSDSMMPTLLDGDFIVVNKYSYGLRWPVLNEKFIDVGTPQRGDVVVFRHPPNPNINYIKRLVGLPGDRVQIVNDQLVINGQTIELRDLGTFQDRCYGGVGLREETLGTHTHLVMSCRSERGLSGAGMPDCNREKLQKELGGGWFCHQTEGEFRDYGDYRFDVVPPGHYLMIGDNRDNSDDSRGWGLVPDQNLVGKATRIWFNFDMQKKDSADWIDESRIGERIP
jgi:signal peptidase I